MGYRTIGVPRLARLSTVLRPDKHFFGRKSPFLRHIVCDNVLYHTLMKPAGDGINELIIAPSSDLRPAPLFAPTRKAARRFLEFFTAQINNAHTRRAYVNATRRFADWCASKDIG